MILFTRKQRKYKISKQKASDYYAKFGKYQLQCDI